MNTKSGTQRTVSDDDDIKHRVRFRRNLRDAVVDDGVAARDSFVGIGVAVAVVAYHQSGACTPTRMIVRTPKAHRGRRKESETAGVRCHHEKT